MSKLYVAYGSNLNLTQMALRCPTARIYDAGILNNWELVYRGRSGNSHATIERRKGSIVPVLIWEIYSADEYRLDIYEGFPHYYFKQNVMVKTSSGTRKAMVYIMDKRMVPGTPSKNYIETIRQGYRDNGFDMVILEYSLEKNAIECEKPYNK